ncbi:hypothetical protein DPMN_044085 [Dreissena polymorpha]|uniref:Uncharacterized protein n=1 Tax=Dreissena polymorpha TaxID=45954 RepID=A0A9D4D2B2_DREPO|nr:hypothetical protein DPMN_044085 [Dreissena polymorpha]
MSSTRGCSVSRPGAPDCLTQGPRLLYLQEALYSQVPQIQLSHNILIGKPLTSGKRNPHRLVRETTYIWETQSAQDNLSINMEQYPENHDHLKNCVTVPSVTL